MQIATTRCRFAALLLTTGLVLTRLAAANASTEIFFADPTVYVENGRYYLTGTRTERPPGFALLESDNLREWRTAAAAALILRAGDQSFGTDRFWAPQILQVGAEYFLTYTADEQVALARSPVLTGPYQQSTVAPVDASERNIDSYLLRDDDGRF